MFWHLPLNLCFFHSLVFSLVPNSQWKTHRVLPKIYLPQEGNGKEWSTIRYIYFFNYKIFYKFVNQTAFFLSFSSAHRKEVTIYQHLWLFQIMLPEKYKRPFLMDTTKSLIAQNCSFKTNSQTESTIPQNFAHIWEQGRKRYRRHSSPGIWLVLQGSLMQTPPGIFSRLIQILRILKMIKLKRPGISKRLETWKY